MLASKKVRRLKTTRHALDGGALTQVRGTGDLGRRRCIAVSQIRICPMKAKANPKATLLMLTREVVGEPGFCALRSPKGEERWAPVHLDASHDSERSMYPRVL